MNIPIAGSQDSRLVALNARDAAERGATILTRTKSPAARRDGRALAHRNRRPTPAPKPTKPARWSTPAAPGSASSSRDTIHVPSTDAVRLVRGSHIVTRKLYDHDRCYFFQGTDGRIIFAIPYEQDFTLIGTTDAGPHRPRPGRASPRPSATTLSPSPTTTSAQPVTADDIVWTYSGVRPLYDDGARSATAATRDYVLKLDADGRRRCSPSSAARSPPTAGWPRRRWPSSRPPLGIAKRPLDRRRPPARRRLPARRRTRADRSASAPRTPS